MGFPCAETETFASHTLPPEVRDGRRGHSQKGSVVLPGEAHEPKSPSVRSSWEQHTAGGVGFEGRTSEMFCPRRGTCKCSFHFKQVISESQRRMTLWYIFKVPMSYMDLLAATSRKGMLAGGGQESELCWNTNLNRGYKNDFLCMYSVCLWFAMGAAAVIPCGDILRNRFE